MDYSGLPIKKLNELILAAGEIGTAAEFVPFVMEGLRRFVAYDQGTAYFFNAGGKVTDWYLLNVPAHWNEAYLEYYEQFSYRDGAGPLGELYAGDGCFHEIDWNFVSGEPILEYIRERGIRRSFYLMLLDDNRQTKVIIALDRVTDTALSGRERDCLLFLAPHLNISYKRFLNRPAPQRGGGDRKLALMKMAGLTRQETRIALQLCAGVSPGNISKALNITPATTHKHIAHIYGKMRVSNIQELLVYLLGPKNSGLDRTK